MAEALAPMMEDLPCKLTALRRYVIASATGNIIWEFVQLPLYTLWHEGTWREIAFAAVHCTAGDVVIGTATLLGALVVVGNAILAAFQVQVGGRNHHSRRAGVYSLQRMDQYGDPWELGLQ